MEHYVLPTVYCPFPTLLNPYVEVVHERSLMHVQAMRLIQQEAAVRRFTKMRVAWLAAGVHPTTGLDELTWVNDWLVWLFMFDDQFDEGVIGTQPERIISVAAELLAITDDMPIISSPIAAALHSFWRRAPGATPAWRERFAGHLAEYFTAYHWEAQNRARGSIPAMEAYIVNRRSSGALETCFDMIELAEHVTLPPEVRQSQELVILHTATNNVVCWVNDMLSFQKELARGDIHNLALIVRHEQRCTWQEALDIVNDMVTREVQLYLRTEHALLTRFPAIAHELEKHLFILRMWMRANLDWSLQSVRYTQVEQTIAGKQVSYLEPLLSS